MIEEMLPLRLPPGLYKNGTEYQAKGRWLDANYIRFFEGTIRPIGGWKRLTDSTGANYATLSGCPRGAHAYRGDDASIRLVVGTTEKLYVITGGTLVDVTPVDLATGECLGEFEDGSGVYGAGDYGAGPYGGVSIGSTLQESDTWSLDNFGDYTVGVLTSDGRLLVWDGNTANVAEAPEDAPENNRAVVVTPERFIFVLGAGGDPRLVQWPSQETTDDWTPSDENTAGDFPLQTAGVIMAGRATRRQTLIWTDTDLHTATYIGGEFIYAFDRVGEKCGLIAPNAVAMANNNAFWMSQNQFFMYDGYVKNIPCEISDYIFSDISYVNRSQIHAQTIAKYNEIWFFYPTKDGVGNTRAAVYNYVEGTWTTHNLARDTGVDAGAVPAPILVARDGTVGQGNLYEHESEAGTRDAPPLIRSGPVELGEGDRVYRVQRVVPDEKTKGDVTVRIRYSRFPTNTPQLGTVITLDGSNPVPTRFTGRMMWFQFNENVATDWRIGNFRFGVRPQGRR